MGRQVLQPLLCCDWHGHAPGAVCAAAGRHRAARPQRLREAAACASQEPIQRDRRPRCIWRMPILWHPEPLVTMQVRTLLLQVYLAALTVHPAPVMTVTQLIPASVGRRSRPSQAGQHCMHVDCTWRGCVGHMGKRMRPITLAAGKKIHALY